MRPRLLLWHWGRRGAGPQMLISLAQALAPLADVALSVSAQSELLAETRALGLPCDAVPTYASSAGFIAGFARLPGLRRRLVAQATAFRADAVVSVMTHLWTPLVAPALPAAGLRFIPIVHDAAPHPGDPAAFWAWRLRRELASAGLAITLSGAVERVVRAARPGLPTARMTLGAHLPLPALSLPAPPQDLAALPHGLPARPHILSARPPGDRPIRLLMFGRLRAYKGLDLLRDAYRLLPPGGFSLRVVGDGPAAALAPGLAELPGVTVENRWVAEAEIPSLIRAADALVLPYREASQSGIIPIAQALGVPVVATPAGGLAEQICDGVDGVMAAAITAPALAAALAGLAAPHALQALADGARRRGAAMADWSAQARVLLAAAAGKADEAD